MLTAEQTAALTRWVETQYSCTVVAPDDGPMPAILQVLRALAPSVPGLVALLGAIDEVTKTTSRTVPLPTGTLVILSQAAVRDLLERARTTMHEAEHARQIQELGGGQTAVDYLFSRELRALREAHACVVAAWFIYLVTGQLPAEPAEMVASLEHHLYDLGADDIELARGIAASNLATMRAGGVPPLRVCIELLAWMRAHAPEALLVHQEVA